MRCTLSPPPPPMRAAKMNGLALRFALWIAAATVASRFALRSMVVSSFSQSMQLHSPPTHTPPAAKQTQYRLRQPPLQWQRVGRPKAARFFAFRGPLKRGASDESGRPSGSHSSSWSHSSLSHSSLSHSSSSHSSVAPASSTLPGLASMPPVSAGGGGLGSGTACFVPIQTATGSSRPFGSPWPAPSASSMPPAPMPPVPMPPSLSSLPLASMRAFSSSSTMVSTVLICALWGRISSP